MSTRVLLVDDSTIVRRSLREALLSGGFEVCGEAQNGKEAVEKAAQLKPEVVLLDLSMPVMNGIQAAQILRARMPELHLLMYTFHANEVVEARALAAGVEKVFDKAASLEPLVTTLRELPK